jgi:hypothetical protein
VFISLCDPVARLIPRKQDNGNLPIIQVKDLPSEVRLIIYSDELSINHLFQPPPLLVALASNPVLYAEARKLYHTSNISITKPKDIFKKRSMKSIFQLRTILLTWHPPLSSNSEVHAVGLGPHLRANKIILKNNITTIVVVYAHENGWGNEWADAKNTVRWRISAIVKSVKRIELRTALMNVTGDRAWERLDDDLE